LKSILLELLPSKTAVEPDVFSLKFGTTKENALPSDVMKGFSATSGVLSTVVAGMAPPSFPQ
jgi:hypothetical protein